MLKSLFRKPTLREYKFLAIAGMIVGCAGASYTVYVFIFINFRSMAHYADTQTISPAAYKSLLTGIKAISFGLVPASSIFLIMLGCLLFKIVNERSKEASKS